MMLRMFKNVFMAASLLAMISSFAYCETGSVDSLLSEYSEATQVQRPAIESAYKYQDISVSGVVSDVVGWNTFDERTDTSAYYYKVLLEPKTTGSGIPYQASIVYKDKAEAESMNKAESVNIIGKFIKINDELDLFSIWVYADKLTDEDKVMLDL